MRWIGSPLKILRRTKDEDAYDDATGGPESRLVAVGQVLVAILMFPIRVLFLPFQSIHLLHRSDALLDDDFEEAGFGGRMIHRVGWLWRAILRLIKGIMLSPFRAIQQLLSASLWDALFILPALMVVIFFGFVFSQVFFGAERIENRYRKGVQTAIADENYGLAKTYFSRLLSSGTLNQPQAFQWAIILARTGESDRATAMIDQLAPDDQPGYADAHRLKAILLAEQIGQAKDPKILGKLRWHLENTRDESPAIGKVWAAYYMAVEQYDKAIVELKKSAVVDPTSYLVIADYYQRQGRKAERENALRQAEKVYRDGLDKDRLEHRTRIALASVLAKLEDYDEAEALLQQGMRIQPDPLIKRALSDFYLMQFDLEQESNAENVERQIEYLVRAIDLDPNFPPVYERLMSTYMDPAVPEEKLNEIRQKLQDIVGGDRPTPMVHFTLSNVLWQEGKKEEARFHIEQAFQMDNRIVVVLNNLAWMVAHEENPDLDRALELIENAIRQAPGEARFRSTYGTVLMKLERYKEAARELELSLSGVTDKKAVHRKLAFVYEEMGLEDVAQIHRQNAAEPEAVPK